MFLRRKVKIGFYLTLKILSLHALFKKREKTRVFRLNFSVFFKKRRGGWQSFVCGSGFRESGKIIFFIKFLNFINAYYQSVST
jgi:hypothetical protein